MTEIDSVGAVTAPLGFSAGATTAGIKESGLPDLALLASDRPATAVGMFTTNQTQAAPLSVSRRHLENGLLRGMIVNSGNANCATGSRGVADAETMTELAASADRLRCRRSVRQQHRHHRPLPAHGAAARRSPNC